MTFMHTYFNLILFDDSHQAMPIHKWYLFSYYYIIADIAMKSEIRHRIGNYCDVYGWLVLFCKCSSWFKYDEWWRNARCVYVILNVECSTMGELSIWISLLSSVLVCLIGADDFCRGKIKRYQKLLFHPQALQSKWVE